VLGLLSVLVIAGVPVLIGGVVGVVYALGAQSKRDDERWAAAAQALGLAVDPTPTGQRVDWFSSGLDLRMYGTRAGMPVSIGIRVVAGRNRRTVHYTYIDVGLPSSLALGLNLMPSAWETNVLAELVGPRDLQVGHPVIDAAYRIQAADADRARALLLSPHVAEALVALSGTVFRPRLSDSIVRLEARQKCFDARTLSVVLDEAIDIAHRVVTPAPSFIERVMAEAWRPVAEARGFVLDAERRAMMGRAEGVHVAVHATQQGDACTTSFIVRFDRPLGLCLSLERQTAFSTIPALFGAQDIETGDPMFDARFIVKGKPPDAVRAALTPEVRAGLVALQEQATHLVVSDGELRADVAWLVTEPAWLHARISAIAQAGALLSGTGEAGVGPYRR